MVAHEIASIYSTFDFALCLIRSDTHTYVFTISHEQFQLGEGIPVFFKWVISFKLEAYINFPFHLNGSLHEHRPASTTDDYDKIKYWKGVHGRLPRCDCQLISRWYNVYNEMDTTQHEPHKIERTRLLSLSPPLSLKQFEISHLPIYATSNTKASPHSPDK